MLTDLQLANLLQDQYDGKPFIYQKRISEVTFFVKENDDEVIIGFEGTYNLPDWISNIRWLMTTVRGLGAVEIGFYSGLSDVLNDLVENNKLPGNKTITVTGHSRGASHANIFVLMLWNAGFKNVRRVTFASPRCGDVIFNAALKEIPGHTYRNFRSADDQDWICDVPLHFMLIPYERPEPCVIIDVPGLSNDKWGIFSRHHLFLYIKGLEKL